MASGGINWHYVAPVVFVGFLITVRGCGLPFLTGSLHEAGMREMERKTGTELRRPARSPSASARQPDSSAGPSMLGWALGLGGMLLVGGGVTTYFLMDRGDDPLDTPRP